jgi:hypothetical protein
MRLNARHFNSERGAGLLEALLAIAIVGAIMPFAYNGVIEMSDSIANAAESKRISDWHAPVMAYVRKNQADWPSSAQIEFDREEIEFIGAGEQSARLLMPYAGFIDKRAGDGGAIINAYMAFRPSEIKEIRVYEIAKLLGQDAAIVADGGEATSAAGWSIWSDVFAQGDLIYRISDILGDDDTYRYLHRTQLDDAELNTMLRDLNMSGKNILDVGNIISYTLNATNGKFRFAETPQITAAEAYFPEGAIIDASKAEFSNVNVNGDISGLRKITAGKLRGAGVLGGSTWATYGNIVLDSASIVGPIHVQRDLSVRAESSRSISGFTQVQTGSVAAPYLAADKLFFAPGFGITISSELLYSITGVPIRLGNWGFPSAGGPKFSEVVLGGAGNVELGQSLAVPTSAQFAPIMKSGWKDR